MGLVSYVNWSHGIRPNKYSPTMGFFNIHKQLFLISKVDWDLQVFFFSFYWKENSGFEPVENETESNSTLFPMKSWHFINNKEKVSLVSWLAFWREVELWKSKNKRGSLSILDKKETAVFSIFHGKICFFWLYNSPFAWDFRS